MTVAAVVENDEEDYPATNGRRTFSQFLRKYFLEGQHMDESRVAAPPADADWWTRIHVKYRKYIAFLIPFIFMHTIWWLVAFRYDFFSLYPTRWQLPLTMVLGAMVAGMTSEGGGAVAFPVMTLLLHIDPTTARDFSIMMQAVGMTSALFVILYMGIQIEKKSVVLGTIGSVPGMLVGFTWLDPLLSAPSKKMFFVSVWASFAIALYLLNAEKKRKTYPIIPEFKLWKALVLVLTGFVGGVFTAFAGSGIDICIFSIITLLFRVTEKTATPTTVVIMGINSQIGFFWRAVMMGDIPPLAWEYLSVSIPVGVTFAPLGSFFGSHFHRMVLAFFVYILEFLALIGFLITGPPIELIAIGAAIIGGGFVFFSILCKIGHLLMLKIEGERTAKLSDLEESVDVPIAAMKKV